MGASEKYLIHARFTADGVVERSDVVGAIFGQTEGLLGDELELRRLQRSSKVGRIDVEVESSQGQSTGTITISASLDRVETATLAAALETISRIGPCRASVEVVDIEDVRSAKRRQVVDRAHELLLSEFGEFATSEELVKEVRRRARTADVTSYEGLPAGPRVTDTDAIVVVEGRADVLALLEAGIKNAIAVEGTDVPDAVADLTAERTVTAFLDGDRGGELILQELAQVGEVDYVTFAPPDRSVEDLSRSEILAALREKVDYDVVADATSAREALAELSDRAMASGGSIVENGATSSPVEDDTTSSATEDGTDSSDIEDGADVESEDAPALDEPTDSNGATGADGVTDASDESVPADAVGKTVDGSSASSREDRPDEQDDAAGAPDGTATGDASADADRTGESPGDPEERASDEPTEATGAEDTRTIRTHAREVIEASSGQVRLLDADLEEWTDAPVDEAVEALREADPSPAVVVVDGTLTQRLLDVAAERGVDRIVAAEYGSFTKRPTTVRIDTAEELLGAAGKPESSGTTPRGGGSVPAPMTDRTDGGDASGRMDDAAVDAFLREQGTGVLALADGNDAYAVPISFGYEEGRAVFAYWQFGDRSRKLEYTEATETACLAVYDVVSPVDWRSVLASGRLRELSTDEWKDLGELMDDNAWSPDLSTVRDRQLPVVGYELRIEEATGMRGKGIDEF